MVDLSYGYANARVKAMKCCLLGEETLRGLFSVGTLSEYIDMLENTAYKQSFVDASTREEGIKLVMAALRMESDKTVAKIKRIVPDNGREQLDSLISLWELKPLQVILAAKASSTPVDPLYIDFLDAAGKDKAKTLMDAPDFGKALQALSDVGYHAISAKAYAEYSHSKDFRIALRMIGRHYYENLASFAKSESDREVRQILQAELDFFNTSTALRLKNAGVVEKEIHKALVKPSAASLALQIAKCPDTASAVALLERSFRFPGLSKSYETSKSIWEVELLLEQRMFSRILRETRVSVLSLGAIFGYIFLKRREIANLRAIALSLQFPSRDAFRKSVYTLKGDVGASG
ncbi:MAG: V-type ATPase subunit [Candidatus Micrarchaeia archaeon]